MCLTGAAVTIMSLTQEVTGSSPFIVMTNILSLNLLKDCYLGSKHMAQNQWSKARLHASIHQHLLNQS